MERRLIAFLDALGIKGIWQTRDSREVVREWEKNVKDFHELKNEIMKEFAVDFVEPPEVKVFSDTVAVIYTGSDPYKILGLMSLQMAYGLCSSMFRGFFFRGTISHGDVESSESLIIGRAVDEAVTHHAKADWMGISLAPSTANLLDPAHNRKNITGLFSEYDVPIKGEGPQSGWALNWPLVLPSALIQNNDKLNPRPKMLETFDKFSFGVADQTKRKNTIKFYDDMISEQIKS